jgi:hypothetical protein
MATGAVLMHVSLFVNTVFLPVADELHRLFEILDLLLRESHDVGAKVRVADDF